MGMIASEIARIYGFEPMDAMMIVMETQALNQWVDLNDLKLQAFRFAQRLVNGGC